MITGFEGREPEQAARPPAQAGGAPTEPPVGGHAEAAPETEPRISTDPSSAEAPTTGDAAIDAVLADLASARDALLAERIDTGERTLAALQSRLNDLGGA